MSKFVYNMNMGVVGAAVATDIAQAISCVVGIIYMMKTLFSTFAATGALTVRVATTYLFQGIKDNSD